MFSSNASSLLTEEAAKWPVHLAPTSTLHHIFIVRIFGFALNFFSYPTQYLLRSGRTLWETCLFCLWTETGAYSKTTNGGNCSVLAKYSFAFRARWKSIVIACRGVSTVEENGLELVSPVQCLLTGRPRLTLADEQDGGAPTLWARCLVTVILVFEMSSGPWCGNVPPA